MNNIQKPFSTNINDLGGDTTFGLTQQQVDYDFRHSIYPTGITCFLCGGTAKYKLIAKDDSVNTAQIQDRGFICAHCLNTNTNIDKRYYGIREIK